MLDMLIDKVQDVRFLTMVFAAIAASATAYALISPLFASDGLTRRMKAVANERERIRQRERERMNNSERVTLRQSPKQFIGKIVHDFNLGKWLAQEEAKEKLVMAGYRGQSVHSRRASVQQFAQVCKEMARLPVAFPSGGGDGRAAGRWPRRRSRGRTETWRGGLKTPKRR